MSNVRFSRVVVFAIFALICPRIIHAGWSRLYGGEKAEKGYSVRQTPDGGYVVLGYTQSYGSGDDKWLFKTDAQGDIIWSKTYPDADGACVDLTEDGGYVVAGIAPGLVKTDAQGNILWERAYETPWVQQTSDEGYILLPVDPHGIFLVKLDEQGDTSWTSTLRYGQASFVQETSDSGYVIAGCAWTDTCGLDPCVIKTDAEGNELWTYTYDSYEYNNSCVCLHETPDKGYIVLADHSTWGQFFLFKIDSLGNKLWHYIYTDDEGVTTRLGWAMVTSDSNYAVVGFVDSTFSPGEGVGRLMFLKFNPYGVRIETPTYDSLTGVATIAYGEQTKDGGFIFVGSYGDTNTSFIDHLWLIKTDEDGIVSDIEEPKVERPADFEIVTAIGPRIVLRYHDMPKGFHAQVFDASGRRVDEIHSSHPSGTLSWGESNGCYGPGIYFIQALSDDYTQVRKVVLIR